MMTEKPIFLPNLFVLGAAKCGTTTLYAHLNSLPGICMSSPKEPYFFECQYEKGLSYYQQKYFAHWQGEKIIGEARHRNLYLPHVPARIHQVNPKAKLIIVIRNPIERAYSHWWHWYRRGWETFSFDEAIKADFERINWGFRMHTKDEIARHCHSLFPSGQGIYRTYLHSGYYYEQIQRYLAYFVREQMLIISFRSLIQEPETTIKKIGDFIGLDVQTIQPLVENKSPVPPLSSNSLPGKIYNTFGLRQVIPASWRSWGKEKFSRQLKAQKMKPSTRSWLQQHYHLHNQQLATFLSCNLSHWH